MLKLAPALLALSLALPGMAAAAETSKTPDGKKTEAKPPKSALTGNALPHCEPGSYPASHVCKRAPPGFYAPAETRFPIACPDGTTSAAGARGPGECTGPGRPALPPTPAKK
jgi:hypothetical protein